MIIRAAGVRFEKVSFEQFYKDIGDISFENEITEEEAKEVYDNIKLPTRGTAGSAGYDFYSPFNFGLFEHNKHAPILIPTGIRIILPEGYFLMLVPRSGVGFKTGVTLANTVGIIDSDYFLSANEGHIKAKFVSGFKDLEINPGERFMQGIILPFAVTEDDEAIGKRDGGFGSTGK